MVRYNPCTTTTMCAELRPRSVNLLRCDASTRPTSRAGGGDVASQDARPNGPGRRRRCARALAVVVWAEGGPWARCRPWGWYCRWFRDSRRGVFACVPVASLPPSGSARRARRSAQLKLYKLQAFHGSGDPPGSRGSDLMVSSDVACGARAATTTTAVAGMVPVVGRVPSGPAGPADCDSTFM